MARHTGSLDIKINIDESMEQNIDTRLLAGQKYIDSEVLRLSNQYTPFDQGILIESATSSTVIGSGEVVYNTPYARYQYYGKKMVGAKPMQVTDIPLNYRGAPMRGAFWFERMKANHKDEILRGTAKVMRGGNKQ